MKTRIEKTILKDGLPARSRSASFSSRKSLIFNSSLLISLVNTSISRSLILIWFLQFFISTTASSKPYMPWKIPNLILISWFIWINKQNSWIYFFIKSKGKCAYTYNLETEIFKVFLKLKKFLTWYVKTKMVHICPGFYCAFI